MSQFRGFDLRDARLSASQSVAGSKRPRQFPHDFLQFSLKDNRRNTVVVGSSTTALQSSNTFFRKLFIPVGVPGSYIIGSCATGTFPEHERFGNGVAGQPVRSVRTTDRLAGGI